MKIHYIFVTGTDTDIGKTWIGALLIHALKRAGHTVIGYKPLACGIGNGEDYHADALILMHASSIQLPYQAINPICLAAATAPTIAAKIERQELDCQQLINHTKTLENAIGDRSSCEQVIVVCEGVGGWEVPINGNERMSDFACALGAQVLLVVGLRLGCLNHARLSERAIRLDLSRQNNDTLSNKPGELVGAVINEVNPTTDHYQPYLRELESSLETPIWDVVKYASRPAIHLPDNWPVSSGTIPD